MANGRNVPMIVDPTEQMFSFLETMGFKVDDYLSSDILSIDYPTGDEAEFLRHYVLGAGAPFANFVVNVDVGVGWVHKPDFEDEEEGKKAKKQLDDFFDEIGFLDTMITFATYFEVLGRASLVKTLNAAGTGFYSNEKLKVSGIDVINPMTLTEKSIREVMDDESGTKQYQQRYVKYEGDNGTIPLDQDRVIYETRNVFAKKSVRGISMYQNAVRELRAVAKFPRYREQIAKKLANVFRHYTVDQDQIKNTPLGRNVLASKENEEDYLLSIQNLIMQQESKHSSIATFKWIESNEKTYGGKEPALADVERQTIEMLGTKMGVPTNLMAYAESVNRATLETIADFFVQRRKNGSQKIYKRIIEEVANQCMKMWGYNGKMSIEFNHFVKENPTAKFDRIGLFEQRCPGLMSDKEKREHIGLNDAIDYGKADDQMKEKQMEMMEMQNQQMMAQAMITQMQRDKVTDEKKASPDAEKPEKNPKQAPDTSQTEYKSREQLDEYLDVFLREKGYVRDVVT